MNVNYFYTKFEIFRDMFAIKTNIVNLGQALNSAKFSIMVL